MPPTISIIIPAYNEENYVRQTLQSLKNQTYDNVEIIVVVNGCTDRTEDIVKKSTNEKIRLLSLPRANVSVARNTGALNASGKLLLFLDADTLLEPTSLQKMKHEFSSEYSVATTRVKPDDPSLKFKIAMGFKNLHNLTGLYRGSSGALLCRKDDFHKVGGYDPEVIMREHRKLILGLQKLGKYKCIDTSVFTSMRRYKKWGLAKGAFFWIKKWGQNNFSTLKGEEYEKVR